MAFPLKTKKKERAERKVSNLGKGSSKRDLKIRMTVLFRFAKDKGGKSKQKR